MWPFNNLWDIIKDPKFYVPSILIILVIVGGAFFRAPVQGSMKTPLFTVWGIEIDIWSLSHILLYIYFGYFFPAYFMEFLFIGILWELFESTYCKGEVRRFVGCEGKNNRFCNALERNRDCMYWYGKIDDIGMNMIGFVIGAVIAKQTKHI